MHTVPSPLGWIGVLSNGTLSGIDGIRNSRHPGRYGAGPEERSPSCLQSQGTRLQREDPGMDTHIFETLLIFILLKDHLVVVNKFVLLLTIASTIYSVHACH